MTKSKTIIKGAFILTLASLITRIMGFIYRIFMSKALGTHGMGVFQLIMPIYMLVFSLCASGLSTVVSNCTASRLVTGDNGGIRKILGISLYISVTLSAIACAAVFFGADIIAEKVLHEPDTLPALKITALCFPFMCAGSVLKGYFYGMQKMAVPAASQVLEQSVRIALIYILCDIMLKRGLKYACAMAVMGMAAGETASFLFTLAAFLPHRAKLRQYTSLTDKAAFLTVLSMALPLTLNRGFSSLLSTAEHILIPQRLMLYGMSNSKALSCFGGLCGMAAPLVMFPCSLLTALATALMPAISEYHAAKNKKAVAHTLNAALTFTSVLGILAGGIFITFPHQIALIVYGSGDIAPILRLLGFICPFLYTQVIMSAALNGINCQLYIFKTGLLSYAISIACVYFLIPVYGLHGYIAGWTISVIISNRLFALRLLKESEAFDTKFSVILKCCLCTVLVCLCGTILLRRLPHCSVYVLCAVIGCCCAFYFVLASMLGVFDIRLLKGINNSKNTGRKI